jgi:hypothetical protein
MASSTPDVVVVDAAKSPAFLEAKSPLTGDLENGALRAGGTPSIYSRQHLGLLAHYAAVGVVYGAVYQATYSVLNNYLQMSAVLVSTASALVRIPRAMRWLAAIFSDCCPIFGYRRRPYMLIGWGLAFVCCFIMAVVPLGEPYYMDPKLRGKSLDKLTAKQLTMIDLSAPDRGVKLIVLMMLANIGTVVAFGAADGYTIELAQREPEATRGTLQAQIAGVRQIFLILSSFLTGLALNGVNYGGDFSWTVGFNWIMAICATFSAVVLPLAWFCMTEDKAPYTGFRDIFGYLYGFMQSQVMYQVVAYKFFRQVFSQVSVTANSAIQSDWAKVTPLNSGLADMVSYFIAFLSLYLVRRYGLNWSWRSMIVVCQFLVVIIDSVPTFLTIWNIVRSQWFWLGVPLLEGFPDTMGDFIANMFVNEITEVGREATIMGVIISLSALGTPFGTVITKSVGSYFDIERSYIKKDTHHVRMEVSYAYIIAYAFNLASCVFVVWLPRQKAEARELKRTGRRSQLMGTFTITYVVFAFCWTVMTNILSLWPSTKCLRIAGGTGCKKTQ